VARLVALLYKKVADYLCVRDATGLQGSLEYAINVETMRFSVRSAAISTMKSWMPCFATIVGIAGS
jgi:hypothetical protein